MSENHRLDRLFGYGFHDQYLMYVKSLRLGQSIEWERRLSCMLCGSLVSFPITHKNWHKRAGDLSD